MAPLVKRRSSSGFFILSKVLRLSVPHSFCAVLRSLFSAHVEVVHGHSSPAMQRKAGNNPLYSTTGGSCEEKDFFVRHCRATTRTIQWLRGTVCQQWSPSSSLVNGEVYVPLWLVQSASELQHGGYYAQLSVYPGMNEWVSEWMASGKSVWGGFLANCERRSMSANK